MVSRNTDTQVDLHSEKYNMAYRNADTQVDLHNEKLQNMVYNNTNTPTGLQPQRQNWKQKNAAYGNTK